MYQQVTRYTFYRVLFRITRAIEKGVFLGNVIFFEPKDKKVQERRRRWEDRNVFRPGHVHSGLVGK